MITRWTVRRLDDRLKFSPLAKSGLNKVFPDHWTFMMGEIALYSFMYLIISGVFLTFFFEASTADKLYVGSYDALRGSEVSAAYASSVQLSFDVQLGLVMRQSHHWAALLFTGAIVVHLCRIFFTGAFRRPREINWLVGLTMLVLAFVNGFAGYSLPDDLLSGTGLRVANAIMLSIPVVGGWLDFLVFGAEFPGEAIIQRLYVAHILLVPALIAGLIAVHLAILARQKHSQFPGPGRTDTNVVGSRMWPSYAARSIGLLFAVFAACLLLGGLVQINPIWFWGPFEPGSVIAPAQPDWYVGWVDGALRIWPSWEPIIFGHRLPVVFLPGAVLPGLTFAGLYLWPLLDRLITHDRRAHQVLDRPRDRPVRVGIGVTAITFYALLLLSFGLDVISRYTGIPLYVVVYSLRVIVLVVPVIAGLIAFVVARALRDSGAAGALALSWSDLMGGLRRRNPPPEPPARPVEDEQEPEPDREEQWLVDQEPLPVRVDAGPVP